MPTRRKLIRDARETAIREDRDPDQVERDMRQEWGMSPLDALDKRQREEKGQAGHPADELTKPGPPPETENGDRDLDELEHELSDAEISKDGKPLTAYERVKRDAAIIQLLSRGITAAQAGAQFGLSVRQVNRIKAQYREEAPDISELDAGGIVRDTLDNYNAAIEELALLAFRTDHGATKVGAIRVRLEALRGRIELLQSVGVLPHDLGQIRVIDDAQYVARQIAEVFQQFNVPEEVQLAVVDVIEGRQPELPQAVDVTAEEVSDAEEVPPQNGASEE